VLVVGGGGGGLDTLRHLFVKPGHRYSHRAGMSRDHAVAALPDMAMLDFDRIM